MQVLANPHGNNVAVLARLQTILNRQLSARLYTKHEAGSEFYAPVSPASALTSDPLLERPMPQLFISLLRDRKGVTALEYALIAALIAVVIIGAVSLLGQDISKVFSTVASTI
jgi:Flp pilus assembly pilin Flp